ncbi:FAD-binding oxidoreductase [Halomarina ordinaria]|uniref:D-lactate dehydrogenase (cytochrome) n=1 Tax=Halomarina ordinaria TaxID=3033939 RepID=A0ABD5U655_9EURY|nr:FAD-binding oxidoreductase [Halomarina sp. PSRA2]
MTYDCSFLADLDVACSFDDDDRESHATDWGTAEGDEGVTPDAVVWPASTDEVATVLASADERGVPVTPYAAGTSLEGNAVPARRGISMNVTRMDAVLDVRPEDFQVDVRPGLVGQRIDEAVAEHGLFFPPMPASADISTIGGMIINDASGMKTVRYGEVGDWVLELEAVLADGTVLEVGSKAVKTSAGYNLKDLLVGSEGTLAVVTRATLRLARLPEQVRGGRAVFPTLDDATEAISATVRAGVDVATIELVDELSAAMANAYVGTDLPDAPMVFFEIHADHGIEEELRRCREAFEAHGVERFEAAADEAEMATLWRARRELALALRSYDEVLTPLAPGDVTVPIGKYPDIVRYAKSLADEYDLLVPTFGHAGDGNVHYSAFADPTDPEMVADAKAVYEKVVVRAIELGGTATGEHGVGLGKREFLELEHGVEGVEAMRRVKRAFDPNDTLNPGKMFPETVDGGRVRVDPADD